MAGRCRGRSAGLVAGVPIAYLARAGAVAAAAGLAAAAISTVAGGGSQQGEGVFAPSASLSFPIGVRPYSGGFLVAEQSRYRIRRVAIADVLTTDTGSINTIAGTGSSGSG